MFGDKEIFHDEICEMAAEQEEADATDFFGGPQDSHEAFQHFIDQETRIVDSYPHDTRWAQAAAHLAMYGRGIMTKTGAAAR